MAPAFLRPAGEKLCDTEHSKRRFDEESTTARTEKPAEGAPAAGGRPAARSGREIKEEILKRLGETSSLKRPVFARIAFLALVLVAVAAFQFGATAQAASVALSWTPPTTYTDGTSITSLGGYKVYTGTTSGSYSQNVDVGNVTSYTVSNLKDSTAYYFAVTAYDTTGNLSSYSSQATFTTPTPPPPASVYTVTASAGSGGSISPSGATAVSQGMSQAYTITANSGYQIAGVTVDGASVGAVSSYTFSNVAANHTIAATFTANASSYSITASAGTGGTISPSGTATVAAGGNQSYTITPSAGYYVASVLVDGSAVASNIAGGAGYSYTFSGVSAAHTISATFAVRSYNIVATAGTGGTVTPANSWVAYQGSQTLTFTPSSGYQVTGVTVDGTSVGAVSSYTFSNISADHTVSVTFGNGFAITASAGTGGTISPSGATTVPSGGSQSYTVTPSTGYYVTSVLVDGAAVASNIAGGAGYSYTFSGVSAAHTISATFAARSYNIVATAGTGGTVTPASSWVAYQGSQTLTFTPSSGYQVASVTVDGTSVGAVSSYTFSNVSADHTVSVTFGSNYTVTASAGSNGSITPSASLAAGSSPTYKVTPNAGYYVVSVVVDGTTVASNIAGGVGYSYTFSNLAANHTISATFAMRSYNIVASAGSNGSVTPGNTWIPYQGAQTVSITPSKGHKIVNVTVDGVSVGAVSSYTFNNISADHTLAATFL